MGHRMVHRMVHGMGHNMVHIYKYRAGVKKTLRERGKIYKWVMRI